MYISQKNDGVWLAFDIPFTDLFYGRTVYMTPKTVPLKLPPNLPAIQVAGINEHDFYSLSLSAFSIYSEHIYKRLSIHALDLQNQRNQPVGSTVCERISPRSQHYYYLKNGDKPVAAKLFLATFYILYILGWLDPWVQYSGTFANYSSKSFQLHSTNS